MIGEPVGCSQQQRHLGRRPLRKCKSRVEESNIVFIDVESDSFENVVIIDSPKSLPTKNGDGSERLTRGNKVRSSWKGVILLDDDEDMNDDFVGAGVKSGRNFKNGASTSSNSNTSSGNFGSPSAAKINGCKFVQENESPVNLSKGKRTYSGKATSGNRFGLADTDDLSCNDYPDCELMEDSFGSVKEQWEKASKRRCNLPNDQPAQSHSNKDTADANKNLNVAKDCGQFEETPAVSKQAKDEAAGSFIHKKKGNLDYTSDGSLNATLDKGEDIPLDSILKNCFSFDHHDSHYTQGSTFHFSEHYTGHDFEPSCTNSGSEEQVGHEGPSSLHSQVNSTSRAKHVNKPFHRDAKAPVGEPCLSRFESCAEESMRFCEVNLSEKESATSQNKQSVNIDLDYGRSSCRDNIDSSPEKTSSSCFSSDPRHNNNGSEENFASQPASLSNTMSSRKHSSNVFSQDGNENGTLPRDTFFDKRSEFNEEMTNGKDFFQVDKEQINKGSSIFRADSNVLNTVNNPDKLSPRIQLNYGRDASRHGPTLNNEVLMMSDREKLKQTDEYKKASEEEWASRQRALKVQAEEAQKLRCLRKRMKAEAARLLDMEKRQKQRVEEIRETQKKDEKNSNFKEIVRGEVRKDLKKLELTCRDMASLLQGLGIPVGGGLRPPLSSEVRAAYKRALLAFHPDRSSRSDVRQQVEAEEKFKLISRMKEKFLPS